MKPSKLIIVTTGNEVAGYAITEYLGIVRGLVVRSVGLGSSFAAGLRWVRGGGEIPGYAAICEQTRQKAYEQMLAQAQDLEADAVIAFRYDAGSFAAEASEVLAYGTAVRIQAAQPAGTSNAGSRPVSVVLPASASPSSPGPRG
jgi:uncharacterized protein YbjQ (UPF0145 family)